MHFSIDSVCSQATAKMCFILNTGVLSFSQGVGVKFGSSRCLIWLQILFWGCWHKLGFGRFKVCVKVGFKLMYTAWCCSGRCADLLNAWLKLMIPLPLYTAPPHPPAHSCSSPSSLCNLYFIRRQWMEGLSISLNFNNRPVVKLLFCTIFHKTHYVPCL